MSSTVRTAGRFELRPGAPPAGRTSFTIGPAGTTTTTAAAAQSRPGTASITRPATAASTPITDDARRACVASDVRRLSLGACSTGGGSSGVSDGLARETASYVLLRRADHMSARRALFDVAVWRDFRQLLERETRVGVVVHAQALLLACAGRFTSDTCAREFVAAKKCANGTDSGSANNTATAASPAANATAYNARTLWRRSWNWASASPPSSFESTESTSLDAWPLCSSSLLSLVSPLLLSVHPTRRSMSGVLLRGDSMRAAVTLQHLWTTGCEVVLAIMQGVAKSPTTHTASHTSAVATLDALALDGFTLAHAFEAYVRSTLQQVPFLLSSQLALWRMMELAIEMHFEEAVHKRDAAAAASNHDTPFTAILAACLKELCCAPACNCCSETHRSCFDPFDASSPHHSFTASSSTSSVSSASSPFVSLSGLLFRLLKLLIDDPERGEAVATLWHARPLLQVLTFHALMIRDDDDATDASLTTTGGTRDHARSELARDAEYVLTRFYFDRRHIVKLLPLLASTTADGGGGRLLPKSSLALYLPPACERLLRDSGCAHFSYTRDGLNSTLVLRPCVGGNGDDVLTSHRTSSTASSPHAIYLTRVVLQLVRKHLLLASSESSFPESLDASSSSTAISTSTSPLPTPSSGVGSAARVVRDLRQTARTSRVLCEALVAHLDERLSSGHSTTSSESRVRRIQSALIEAHMRHVASAVRVTELFELAHRCASAKPTVRTTKPGRPTAADLLYGLGTRVLLCLVDALDAVTHSGSGSTGLGSAGGWSEVSRAYGGGAFLRGVVQEEAFVTTFAATHAADLAAALTRVLDEGRALFNATSNSTSAQAEEKADDDEARPRTAGNTRRPLRVEDIFDPTEVRRSPLEPPCVHHRALSYTHVLEQVRLFFLGLVSRANPLGAGGASSLGGTSMTPSLAPSPPTTALLRPVAPLVRPIGLGAAVGIRRPFSSHTARPARTTPRHPASAGPMPPLTPRMHLDGARMPPLPPSSDAVSVGGRARAYKAISVANASASATAQPPPPRHTPPTPPMQPASSTPRITPFLVHGSGAPVPVVTPLLRPLIAQLNSGGDGGALQLQVSTPIGVKHAAAHAYAASTPRHHSRR